MQKDNSPKIYLIEKQGKFYNAKEQTYYPSIVNATYEKDKRLMIPLMNLPRFIGCNIYTVTEHEFMVEMANQTTTAVLAGEYFHNLLFKLAARLPTISQVNKTMLVKIKNVLEVLKPFDKMYQGFLSEKEDDSDEVQGHYAEYIAEVVKVQIYQTAEVTALLKAYHLDRGSMMGMVKKVHKLKG
jgi:hypothetical protein